MQEYFNTTGETAGENEGAAMKGLVEQMEWEEPEGRLPAS